MARRRRQVRALFGRARRAAGAVTTRIVRVVPQPVRNFSNKASDKLKLRSMFTEALLEVAGGVASAAVDEYTDSTATKDDDRFAPYVKAAAGLVMKRLGGSGLRHMAIAMNGHNFGQWARRLAMDAVTARIAKAVGATGPATK